jgi:hypothetical protein
MTDLRRLQNGLNRLDMDEIQKALYGECVCESLATTTCKQCGAKLCGDCARDHAKWEMEIDPRDERRF